jgi:hypothetical protein
MIEVKKRILIIEDILGPAIHGHILAKKSTAILDSVEFDLATDIH